MPNKRPRIGDEADEALVARQSDEDERAPPRTARGTPSRSVHDNRKRLGVDQEHRTETMRRRGRGTFP